MSKQGGKRGLRLTTLSAVALLSFGIATAGQAACVDAPRLSARLDGTEVRLSWLGGLDAGDGWALYNASRAELEAMQPGSLLYSGTASEHVHPVAGELYYQLRCEGPGGDGPWSNMAFRLERDLFGANFGRGASPPNHLLSLPLEWTPPDVGGGGDSWPCDDAGDGVATLDEALCALWSDVDSVVDGRMSIEALHQGRASFLSRIGMRVAGSPPEAIGSAPLLDDLVAQGNGLNIRVEGDSVSNPVVLVGAHDPDFPGYLVSLGDGSQRAHVLALPYHGLYRTANELLCGLEGFDWFDDGSGNPDICENGLFDPASGVVITVQTRVNDPVSGSLIVGRTAFDAGGVRFIGTNFDLLPGDAVIVSITTGYGDRVFLPPTF